MPVVAHPIDEVVQQVYVRPSPDALVVDVELAIGLEVAADALTSIDTDGDGTIDDVESSALVQQVADSFTVEVDGRALDPAVGEVTMPTPSMLTNGEGVVAIELRLVDLPAADGDRTITITDSFAPQGAGGPVSTRVQINLTPAVDQPVAVRAIDRSGDGRTFTATFAPAAAPAPSAEGASPSTTFALVAVIAVVGAAAAARAAARRRTRQLLVHPMEPT